MSGVLDHDVDLYSDQAAPHRLNDLSCAHDRKSMFDRDGFLVIGKAISIERTQAAIQAVDDLIDGMVPDFRGVQFEPGHGDKSELKGDARRRAVRKLMRFVDFDPRLHELAYDTDLLAVVSLLMDGQQPHLFQDMALLKPPGGSEKPWHQDMAYFNVPIDTPVIGVWIALEDANVDNGALRMQPGSHLLGPMEHFKRRDWQICDTQIDRGRDLAVPLPAGGALIWHGLTQHGSPINRSDQRRRALQFHYRPASTQETTSEERMAIYGGDVRGAEC